jgi:hypothetical protein
VLVRVRALRSLRWNYPKLLDAFSYLLDEAECDCSQCDGWIPQFDVDALQEMGEWREIVCSRCGGRGFEPAGERNIVQLLDDPAYFIHRQEKKRDLRTALAEGAFA